MTRLALALMIAVTLRVSVALPAAASAQLRAFAHCASHEGMPVSPIRAAQCCGVQAPGDDEGRQTAAPALDPPTVAAVDLGALAPLPVAAPVQVAQAPHPSAAGPPRFLSLRTIRC